METVTLQTESYLYEGTKGQFRATPFHELSTEEWIVYENGYPKYLIDFNRRTVPVVKDFKSKIDNGQPLEELVQSLGKFLGKQWTTKHNIQGTEIHNSYLPETVTVIFLDDLADFFTDLIFVATNTFDPYELPDEDKLLDTFGHEDINSYLEFESAFVDTFENLQTMLTLLFRAEFEFKEIVSIQNKQVFDLTDYKHQSVSMDKLDEVYEKWIGLSGRQNTMDEYGNLMGIISYINRTQDKEKLYMLTEKRKLQS